MFLLTILTYYSVPCIGAKKKAGFICQARLLKAVGFASAFKLRLRRAVGGFMPGSRPGNGVNHTPKAMVDRVTLITSTPPLYIPDEKGGKSRESSITQYV